MQKLIVKRVSLRAIIILFLCSGLLGMNGLILSPLKVDAIGSSTSGCRESRPVDIKNSSNDYNPVIGDFTPPLAPKFINNGTAYIHFNISVYDEDESNDITVPPWNGTHIASVTINLTEFGIPIHLDMNYLGNFSEPTGDINSSRGEGWYEYNFTIPNNWEADDYKIIINATDNGPNPKDASGVVHLVKVYQYNRAPAYTFGPFANTFNEDAYNTNALEIDFNDLFIDVDVDEGPFNNTEPDSLTFRFWFDGAWFSGAGIKNFENFTLQFNGSDGLFLKSVENQHVTGQTVNLSAIDAVGEMAEHLLTITITSVNDLPVLNGADTWDLLNDNVTAGDATTLHITQGYLASMNVTATDVDGDTLYFALESFDANTTALTSPPFFLDEMTGNLNFKPDNNAVGTFIVNISVRDSIVGIAQDWGEFNFEVLNANDPPMIIIINNMAPVDKAIALNAMQDIKFTAVITAADLDVARELYADELTFAVDTTKVSINKIGNTTANLTFTPTNDDVGEIVVNITVMDAVGIEADDYVVATITVHDVNDAPEITGAIDELGSAITINDKMIDLTKTPLTEVEPNVTFILTAMDIDLPYGEVLEWDQENHMIPAAAYLIEKGNANQTARITIVGQPLADMEYIFNFTVFDDGTPLPMHDYVLVKIKVEIQWPPPEQPEESKLIVILKPYNPIVEPGDMLTLNGTVDYGNLDPNSTIKVMIKISNAGTELLLQAESVVKNGKFTYNFKIPEMINGNLTVGTWIIEIWATDGENNSSVVRKEITIPAHIPSPEDDEEELVMSMGLFSYDIFLIFGIILVVFLIILALLMLRKFKPENLKPEEKQRVNDELYIGKIEEPNRFEDKFDRI